MIDWISAILPVSTTVPYSGVRLELSADGEILNENVLPATVTGSWSSTVVCCNIWKQRHLRCQPVPAGRRLGETYVYVSGNPAKYLQGHNIYGSDDVFALTSLFFSTVAKNLGLSLDVQDLWSQIGTSGRFELTRIDVTYNFRVDGGSDGVNRWIRACHRTGRISHKHASPLQGNTLYFGKNSRRHTVKFYNKRQDLNAHPIDPMLYNHSACWGAVHDAMLNDAEGLLRCEQTFRGKKLREMGFDYNIYGLTSMRIKHMFNDGLSGLNISENIRNDAVDKKIVGNAAYTIYLLWLSGLYDPSNYSRMTNYRHRKVLLEYGIDITLDSQTVIDDRKMEIPLIEYIKASPVVAPSFYHEYGLLKAA